MCVFINKCTDLPCSHFPIFREGKARLLDNNDEENIGLAAEVHDLEASENDGDEEYVPPSPPHPSSKGVRAMPQKEEVSLEDITEPKYIIFKSCLMAIFRKITFTCIVKNCRKPVSPHLIDNGSAVAGSWVILLHVYLMIYTCTISSNSKMFKVRYSSLHFNQTDVFFPPEQMCAAGHEVYSWTSQPQLPNGIYLGNFQASTSVTLSGNNFTKVALFAKFLGMGFPTKSTYNRVQSKYVAPVVEDYWNNLKSSVVEEHRSTKVVVSGKSRFVLHVR